MTTLPTLYKLTSKGAVQIWKIETNGNVITTTHGQQDGKKQISDETIPLGKNIGKANETTPAQQAEAEALSAWNKKKDRQGYKQTVEELSVKSEDGGSVMLAHKYSEHADKMPEVCYGQPKFDGHRCKAVTLNGVCTLLSRTNEPIIGVPHINKYLLEYHPNTVLDGELYNHDYRDKFEELTSFINQKKTPKPGHEVVQMHIYDVILNETFSGDKTPYKERLDWLNKNIDSSSGVIIEVETKLLTDAAGVETYFRECLANGYEGEMLRDPSAFYKNGRSYGLQKVKEMDDAEFTVLAITEGRGKMLGHAMLVCSLPNGDTFDCKLKGSYENLKRMFDNPGEYVGRNVTVQYQGYTKYGKPRFPVGLRFRTDV